MPRHYPTIDLAGYQRLHDIERRIWYSPVAIVLSLMALAAAGYTFWALGNGFPIRMLPFLTGYAVVLACYGALFAYCHAYRFRNLKCPTCDQLMQPYITDLDEIPRFKVLQQLQISGRCYRRPYDEDDRRPWIRLMANIRACPHCKTFVNCSRLHFETCTADELAQIQQRVPG